MPASWMITKILRIPSLLPGRAGQEDTWVEYLLATGEGNSPVSQTFRLRIPNATPTPQEIEAAVQNEARIQAQILGKKGTV